MKHFYVFVIFFLFSIFNLSAQKQISHFVSENSDTKNIVKEIDGKNYLLSFFQNDELGIYEIIAQDSVNHLHNRYFQGIYENDDVKIYGKHMVFESYSGLIIYDFINDSYVENKFDYNISYIATRYPSDRDFLATISVKDTSLFYKFIIDFEGNITDTIVSAPVYNRREKHLVLGNYQYNEKKYTYSYYNYKSGLIDTLCTVYNGRNEFCMGDDKMWYQDNGNNLIEYEYSTGNKTLFQNVSSYTCYYRYVFKAENKLYLYNYNYSDRITHIQIFDIDAKMKIDEITIEDIDRIQRKMMYFYNDKIVMCVDDGFGEIVIIDPATKKYTIFEMYDIPYNLQILDGGKILNQKWHHGSVFEYIDIDSQTSESLRGNYEIVSRRQDFVKIGNGYIGSFYQNFGGSSVFVFNIDSLEYYPAKYLDNTNTGFEANTRIVKINGKIMVLGDNLYQVNDDTLEKINTQEINTPSYRKYSVQNNKVYYMYYDGHYPDEYYYINSYDTKELSIELKMKTNWDILTINKFFDVGDYLYFVTLDNLYKYNKIDSSITFVDSHIGIFYDERSLIKKDNYIYFISGDGLKMIKDNESPKSLIHSVGTGLFEYLLEFKERLFYVSENGLYEIKGEDIEVIYENNFDYQMRLIVVKDKLSENLIILNRKNGIYHFDGTDITEIFDSSTVFSIYPAIGESFIFKSENNSEYEYLFYNCITKEITNIPSDIIEGNFIDVFVSNEDTILLSKQWRNPNDVLFIYKATDNFSNLELIKEIQDAGKGRKTTFKSFGNEGILYTGDKILLMDDNLNFHPLEGIKGDYEHPEIIEVNGDLYFLAIEKKSGRQLYKTTLYSYRPNTTDNFTNSSLNIFPNPVKDILYLDNADIELGYYFEIIHLDGKSVMKGQLMSKSINISTLEKGLYFISIKNGNKVFSGKFVKQ